MLIVEENFD
jgi:hypothetical protein